MRNKKSTFLLVATFLISAVVATINLTAGAQNGPSSKKQDEPTLVQEGLLKKKQKHHSKLFKKYDSAVDFLRRHSPASMDAPFKVTHCTILKLSHAPGCLRRARRLFSVS